jgi:hypothetical protein
VADEVFKRSHLGQTQNCTLPQSVTTNDVQSVGGLNVSAVLLAIQALCQLLLINGCYCQELRQLLLPLTALYSVHTMHWLRNACMWRQRAVLWQSRVAAAIIIRFHDPTSKPIKSRLRECI